MTIRSLVYALVGGVLAFATLTFNLPAHHVFHVLNAVVLGVGVLVWAAYSPGMIDAWRNRREGITAGHLLTFGVVANWTGLTIRLGRWFFTTTQPASGFEQWAYNVGLAISVLAGLMLVGAVATLPPGWSPGRLLAHAALFAAAVCGLWWFDYYFTGVPHFGPVPL